MNQYNPNRKDQNTRTNSPDTNKNQNGNNKKAPHAPGAGSDKQHPETPPKSY